MINQIFEKCGKYPEITQTNLATVEQTRRMLASLKVSEGRSEITIYLEGSEDPISGTFMDFDRVGVTIQMPSGSRTTIRHANIASIY